MNDGPSNAAAQAQNPQSSRRLAEAVERASAAFASNNLRFTDLRRQVFEEIAATFTAVGAYEVLDRLASKGTRLAPISVYRAIDALLEAGVIHRLESKNAFFACRRPHGHGNRPIFLVCETCGTVSEVDGQEIFDLIDRVAKSVSFQPKVKFVEVSGTCSDCAKKG